MEENRFEVLNAALDGINLVEASAGTGKTYSIAVLFLRWILSDGYNGRIDSVVVVTFTKYATAELKDRILAFLEKALGFFHGKECKDEQIREICRRIPLEKRDVAVKNLKSAVNNFDTASIFTIHGFCHRLILENAFEIGSGFALNLNENPDVPHDTALEFFRRVVSKNGDRDFLSVANKELSVKNFENLLKKAGTSGCDEVTVDENRFPDPVAREKLAAIYSDFLKKAPEIARENRRKSDLMSFDDLISVISEILRNDRMAQKLKESMKDRYSLVMIDEFQDTDPLQYYVFKELFCGGNHVVFFIGDPKQSIYSFRNADIFSYLKASESVGRKYVMDTNFRSTAAAVNAVNNIFRRMDFGIREIGYPEIKPENEGENPLKLRTDSSFVPSPGMLVYEVGSDGEKIANIKERIRNMLRDDSSYTLNGGRVKPSDIAVLTSTNRLAAAIYDALKEENFPVSLEARSEKSGSVFGSFEAKTMFRLIKAAETRGFAEFKALLPTCFYNKTVDEIAGCENEIQKLYEEFTDSFADWDKKGFFTLFSRFIEKDSVISELTAGGVETFIKIKYLAELINNFETVSGFSVLNTCEWFESEMNGGGGNSSEEEFYCGGSESGDTVRILTLHKSKGLEFNIVFFIFDSGGSREWIARHSPEYRKELRLIKYNNRDHSAKGDDEAEEIREFYVGITRAKYLTVYYLPQETFEGTANRKFKELLENSRVASVKYIPKTGVSCNTTAEKPAFQFEDPLLHYKNLPIIPPEEPKRAVKPEWAVSSYSGIVSANRNGGEYFDEKYDEFPEENAVSSDFTGDPQGKEPSPMSVFPKGSDSGTVLHAIFEKIDFQAGDNSEIIREILKREMNFEEHGLEDAVIAVSECVRNVLTCPMLDGRALKDVKKEDRSAETEFHLKIKENVGKGQLSEITKENFCCDCFDEESVPKGFMHGYIDLALKIDGKYYIIDWKSNYMGDFTEDYSEEKIRENMKKHCYFLQYMIYLAAFDRYVSSVDPDYSYSENFGGIRYVFLRGVRAGSVNCGIFSDRPDESLLRRFQQLFEGER